MTFKEIQELIKLINKSNLTEFKMKDGDFNISIRTKKYGKGRISQIVQPQQQILPVSATSLSAVPMQSIPQAPPPVSEPVAVDSGSKDGGNKSSDGSAESAADKGYLEIRSPIVGTFYRASSPDKPQYVKPGDRIEVGTVVCIVEAMKLFNEIESEVAGTIIKVMTDDASPVQFDQVLYLVDPKG